LEEILGNISKVKEIWRGLYATIIEVDNREGRVFSALTRIILEDRDLDDNEAVGALRVGLNAINRFREK
jgi:hypothetical protein